MKKVSADTISELTLQAALPEEMASSSRRAPARIPTVNDLLAQLKKEHPGNAAAFEKEMQAMPEGFRLAPVLYSKLTEEQNSRIEREYLFSVRPRFLQYLARNHAQALRDLGICEHGIGRMEKGIDPATEKGMYYDISIDHIIERAGSGTMGLNRVKDPDQDGTVSDKYPPNHFANLILLPEKIHHYKNRLNSLQGMTSLRPGESKWILMMVPLHTDKLAASVCPGQPQGHAFAGLDLRPMDGSRRIGYSNFLAARATESLVRVQENPVMKGTMSSLQEIAHRRKTTVAEMAGREQTLCKNQPNRGLKVMFNATAAYDAGTQKHIDTLVLPALDETRKALAETHDYLTGKGDGTTSRSLYKQFVEFYNGRNVRNLRLEAAKFPVDEAVALTRECDRIAAAIEARALAESRQRSEADRSRGQRNQQKAGHNSRDKKQQGGQKQQGAGGRRHQGNKARKAQAKAAQARQHDQQPAAQPREKGTPHARQDGTTQLRQDGTAQLRQGLQMAMRRAENQPPAKVQSAADLKLEIAVPKKEGSMTIQPASPRAQEPREAKAGVTAGEPRRLVFGRAAEAPQAQKGFTIQKLPAQNDNAPGGHDGSSQGNLQGRKSQRRARRRAA